MSLYHYPKPLKKAVEYLKKLPGVGAKTAERFVFELLRWNEQDLIQLGESLSQLKKNIQPCLECGALQENQNCLFCSADHRNSQSICVLSSPREVFLLENTHSYNGLYHVIDNLLSPLEGKNEENVGIDKLIARIQKRNVTEVVIALESTLEGDATSLFIKECLQGFPVSLSRLALGIPLGSSLEYIDPGTLSRALTHRQRF